MSFTITLPSNSSLDTFPFNTISNFNTYLPKEICLDSDYEVALTEIQYTNSFYNIGDHCKIKIRYKTFSAQNLMTEGVTKEALIPRGYYDDLDQLLRIIKRQMDEQSPNDIAAGLELRYQNISRKIRLIIPRNRKDYEIKFPKQLQAILGFDKEYIDRTTLAPRAIDINALVHSMYAYCNLLAPRIVGDSEVPLLRTIPIHGTHNQYVMESFFHLQYTPLKLRNFRTIEIDLRNNIGDPMPFHSGEAILTLHFRKILR